MEWYHFQWSWLTEISRSRTVICPCAEAALTGLTSGVLRVWTICVWLPVPLYGVVAALCHRHLRGSAVFEPWGTFDYLIFGACILWSYGTLFLDSLESLWLDNARCELKISLWAWSSCVDLCRPILCLDSGKLCDCAVRPSESHRLFDLLWPSGRVAVTLSKGLSPGFRLYR